MNLLTTTIARWIFALPFVMFGVNHLMSAEGMAGMVPGFMPGGGKLWIYITGLVLIVCGLAIAIQKMDKWASLILAVLVLSFILFIHLPGAMSDDAMTKMSGTVNFLKDTIILGAVLTYAGLAGTK